MNVRTLLGATAVAVAATTAFPAPASAGVAPCTVWAVDDTDIGGGFTVVPPSVTPTVSLPDAGEFVNCVLDTAGLCTYNYDPVGPWSEGLEPETTGYVHCLVLA